MSRPGPTKEENALKAKLRRLCEIKKNGQLQVPKWLHEQWKNGDHMAMAKQFQECNFEKDCFPTINVIYSFHICQLTLPLCWPSNPCQPSEQIQCHSNPGRVHQVQGEVPDQERQDCQRSGSGVVFQGRYGEDLKMELESYPKYVEPKPPVNMSRHLPNDLD